MAQIPSVADGLLQGAAAGSVAGSAAPLLSGSPPLDWNDALLLLLLPIAIALLATQVARGALMRALRERL